MSWTTPRTWVAEELVTATLMNTHVRDNLAYLKGSPTFDGAVQITNGLTVGFLAAPTDDAVAVGDANFSMALTGGNARITFDAALNYMEYNRASSFITWVISTTQEMKLRGNGLQITNGIDVGFTSGTPQTGQVRAGDINFGLNFNGGVAPRTTYDSGDFCSYDRTSNFWDWEIASTQRMKLDASGLQIPQGAVVGFSGTPADNAIQVGDSVFALDWGAAGTDPTLRFDTGDSFFFTRSSNTFTWNIGSTAYLLLTSAEHRVTAANAALFGVGSFGSGTGVVYVANAGAAPTANPASGGLLYAAAGAGKWRGSGGTVTTFGPAEPHCPRCGRDCALEHENAEQGWHIAVCMWCLVTELNALGVAPEKYVIPPSAEQAERLGAGALAMASPAVAIPARSDKKGPATVIDLNAAKAATKARNQ